MLLSSLSFLTFPRSFSTITCIFSPLASNLCLKTNLLSTWFLAEVGPKKGRKEMRYKCELSSVSLWLWQSSVCLEPLGALAVHQIEFLQDLPPPFLLRPTPFAPVVTVPATLTVPSTSLALPCCTVTCPHYILLLCISSCQILATSQDLK